MTTWTAVFLTEVALTTSRQDRVARSGDHGWIMHRPFGLWSLPPLEEFGTDARGFRLAEDLTEEKPPGVTRIAMLGGSALFGFSVESGKSIPHQLERRLRQQGAQGVEALNFGMPGYSSTNELIQTALQVVYYDPDFVVVFDGWNDFNSDGYIRHYNAYVALYRKALDSANFGLTSLSASLRNVLGNTWSGRPLLALLRALESRSGTLNPQNRAALKDMREHPRSDDHSIAQLTWAKNLRAMAGILDAFQIPHLFVMQPQNESDPGLAARYREFEQTFLQTCEKLEERCYSFVSIFDAFDSPASLYLDSVHFTPSGNQQIAHALAQLVDQELGLTGRSRRPITAGGVIYKAAHDRTDMSQAEAAEQWVLVNPDSPKGSD